jgi:cell division cycle 2-like protein
VLRMPYNIRTFRKTYFPSTLSVQLIICSESPMPKHPDLFGSFPSAAAGERYARHNGRALQMLNDMYRKRKPFDSPSAPIRAADYKLLTDFDLH